MKFCSKCFNYNEIVEIIEFNGIKGNCDIQDSHSDVFVCDINEHPDRTDQVKRVLLDIIDLYSPLSSLPKNFPKCLTMKLSDALYEKWTLFSLNAVNIEFLLNQLFKNDTDFNQKMFNEKVGILKENEDYSDMLIVPTKWESFVEDLKYNNRYHTNHLKLINLKKFLVNATKVIKPGDYPLYRCRISNNQMLDADNMSAPPKGKSKSGRLNANGIQMLYIATSKKTCIKEVRASFGDTIYIADIELKEQIRVVDLTKFEEISLNSEHLLLYYFNRDSLIKIAKELSRPTSGFLSSINYVPTQYVSDYIKSLVNEKDNKKLFDGILYPSTMHEAGLNLAVFDPEKVNIKSVTSNYIKSVEYGLDKKLLESN